MPRFAPRIKKHRDGTCSLIGLTPTMLSDIFMSAALYRHEDDNRREADRPACLAKIDAASDTMMQEVMRENLEEGDRWCRNQMLAIKAAQKVLSPAYDHGYRNVPVTQLDPLGRWCRMRDARDQREFRLGMKRLMATIRQKHLTPK
jgi:hypothetical protein